MDQEGSWEEAPPFLLQVPDRNERIAIRNANHNLYCSIGTTNMWTKYIHLGYYVFDDCMDFQQTLLKLGNPRPKMPSPFDTKLFGGL